jgi:oxygen-independent coproporphyrinogen III oxidase
MWLSKIFPQHIYIHWPFCKSKCHYCDFLSFAKKDDSNEKYHKALLGEIKNFSLNLDSNIEREIKTIFLGGGTPSLYPLYLLEELFEKLKIDFNLKKIQEVTIEVNPEGVQEHKLKVWKKIGINRLSVGVQVLDDLALQKMNRNQKKKDFFDLMQIAPNYFDNISVDLILGLPGVSEETWMATLAQIASMPIKHISVYFLTIYDKTPLFYMEKKGKTFLDDDDKLISLYEKTVGFLKQKGFLQYEISNFAKSGFESSHNKSYWDFKPYYGFGLGASSFDGNKRFINLKNLDEYISLYSASSTSCGFEPKYFYVEVLNEEQKVLEKLMLGLRQNKGISLHRMLYCLDEVEKLKFIKNLKVLVKENLIRQEGDNLALTLRGMVLESEVILNIYR